MGSEIVCQVIGQADQVTFIWSEGPASFEPYQLSGQGFISFRNLATQARDALSVLVRDYLAGTDEDIRRSGYDLAKVGSKLYQQIFRPAAGPSQYVAKRARTWLGEIYGYGQVESLEIVMDGFGPIPWNVVYDGEPKEAEFLSGEGFECWRPFWGLRYNLAGGRRVEPLRRLPWLVNPKLLMVIDPAIRAGLPAEQRARLEEFVRKHEVHVASTKEALAGEMEERRPDVMYWLCHASASAMVLDGEDVSPGDLLDLFRSQADDDRLGGIAFLNACQTAESTEEGGSFMDALHEVGLSGVIATEHQTVDTFAHPFGLDFLEAFLYEGKPIGQILHDLRAKGLPLGLLYSTYCPPGIRVVQADSKSGETKILAASRLPGVALSAAAAAVPLAEARRSTAPREPIPLPEAPYRRLAPFERRDRALFVGRDDDIRRFSLILDDHSTRLFVLHGESGVGKSSFLRAGVIPYLEEECVGYQFLAVRSVDEAEPEPRFIRATADLIGQVARALCEFCDGGYSYSLHSVAAPPRSKRRPKSGLGGRKPTKAGTAEVDLAEIARELVGGELRPEVVAGALRADVGLFGRLMREISARLPRAPVLVIDQAEEVFTLARSEAQIEDGRQALAMLRRSMAEPGNFKVIISLRTEYYGRLVDRLRSGVREAVGLREYLLTEFRHKGLVEALLRPTLDRPIEGSDEIPREKYGFRFEDGVAERIARDVLDGKLAGHDSVLPLIQVIGALLVETAVRPGAVLGHAEYDAIGGVKGGMRRHVEQMVARLLRDHPSDARRFRKLMTRLYLRQPDGALTTALIPLADLKVSWSGRTPFADLARSAVALNLLKVAVFDVDGKAGRPYASLGHDALARVAAAWDEELRRSERLRKMIAATAASLLLAGVMSALCAIAVVQRSRAEEATARAVAQKSRAEKATARAVAYLDETLQTLDRSLVGVANVDLVDVPQMVPIRVGLLGDAQDGFGRIVRQFAEGQPGAPESINPSIRRGMGRAYRSLGDIERLVGQHASSKLHLGGAIELLGPARPDQPPDDRIELARAYRGMGETRRLLDDIGGAEGHLKEAIGLSGPLAGRHPEARSELTASHHALAALLAEFTDRADEARAEYRAAIDLLPPGSTLEPRYKDNLGRLELADGDVDRASALFGEAAKILSGRIDRNPEIKGTPGVRWQSARVDNNRASILYSRGSPADKPEVDRLLGESRRALEGLVAEFTQVEQYRKELAYVELNLAAIARQRGRDALENYLKTKKIANTFKKNNLYLKFLPGGAFAGLPENLDRKADLMVDDEVIPAMKAAAEGFNASIYYLRRDPAGGDDPTRPDPTPAEVEWPRLVARAELHVTEAWLHFLDRGWGLVKADLKQIDDDLRLLDGVIARLEGPGPPIALPKYHFAIASGYHAVYDFADFVDAHFTNAEVSARTEAGAALASAIEHQKRAASSEHREGGPARRRLVEYEASLEKFDAATARP